MRTTIQNRAHESTIQPIAPSSEPQALPRVDSGRNSTVQSQLDSATRLGHHFARTQVTAQDLHSKANGKALPDPVRTKMEQVLGADLSQVRIHEGEQAASIGAHAYTRGNHIHFAPGAYRPNTLSGQRVLGHELTHVVQQRQRRLRPTGRVKGLPVTDNPVLEAQADSLGLAAAQGNIVRGSNHAAASQSVHTTVSSPIQAIWRNKLTGMTRSDPPKRQTGDWEWIPDDDAMPMDIDDDDGEEASSETDNRIGDPDYFTAKMKAKEGRFNWDLNDIKAAKNAAPQDAQGRWCPGCGESMAKKTKVGSHGREQKGFQIDHWGTPLAERKDRFEKGKPWKDSSGTSHKVDMNKFRAGDSAEAKKLKAVSKQDVRVLCPTCNAKHSLEHTPVGSEPFWNKSKSGRVNQGAGAFRSYRLNDPKDLDSDDEDGTAASIRKNNAKAKKARKRSRDVDDSDV